MDVLCQIGNFDKYLATIASRGEVIHILEKYGKSDVIHFIMSVDPSMENRDVYYE